MPSSNRNADLLVCPVAVVILFRKEGDQRIHTEQCPLDFTMPFLGRFDIFMRNERCNATACKGLFDLRGILPDRRLVAEEYADTLSPPYSLQGLRRD